MINLDTLIAHAGEWHGESTLQDPHNGIAAKCASTASITPLLGNRFARFDYTWSYKDKPQQGSLLIGFVKSSRKATAHWIDSWHMNDVVMVCEGTIGGDGSIDVRGSYAAPPGPDWGWRTQLRFEQEVIRLVMHNIWPEGKEELAVEAVYRRKA